MPRKTKIAVGERLANGEITHAEAYELTRESALNSLDRAMQCRHGLASKLLSKGYPAEVVDEVLERLVSVGLVNDLEYARVLVRARSELGYARRAVGAELARKGIAKEIAEQALETLDPETETRAAACIAEKVVRRCNGLTTEVKARRVFGAVSRRGYSPSIASAAVARALVEESHSVVC